MVVADEREYLMNKSDGEIKRARISIVGGHDMDGEPIITSTYDLSSEIDRNLLMKIVNEENNNKFIGFLLEKSNFADGEYDNTKLGELEFLTIFNFYTGKKKGGHLIIDNHPYRGNYRIILTPSFEELKQVILEIILAVNEINPIALLKRYEKDFKYDEENVSPIEEKVYKKEKLND